MSLVQAKCTNCGANIKVDDTKEAGICEACGTAFITEKVIQNYNIIANTANISSENVTVNIYGKNVDALIKKGVQIIKNTHFFDEDEISELKRLSQELLDVQANSYYGNLFLFASGFSFGDADIDCSLVFTLLDDSAPQEVKTFTKSLVFGYLQSNTEVSAKTTNSSNIGIKLESFNGFSTLGLINILEHFQNTFNDEELKVYSSAKRGYVDFVEKCFEHIDEELSTFYFSKSSLEDFEFKQIVSKFNSLISLVEFSKDIISDNDKIKELGKSIGTIINKNAKIIGADLFLGKGLLERADECPIIDFNLNEEVISVSIDVFYDTVVLSEDKIVIGNNQYKIEINVADIILINSSVVSSGFIFYDIVYKLDAENISCFRLICNQDNSKNIISWMISKEIRNKNDSEWALTLPIHAGFSKYKYVEKYCFLSKTSNGNVNVVCLYPSFAFLNGDAILYSKINHANVSNFLSNQQRLELGTDDASFFLKVYFEVKNENAKFAKINEILLERAKVLGKREISTGKKGACYVATCVYGSYDCPEVWTLRRYRDNTLGSTWYGRAFIRTYYAISPTLVKWFGDTKWFKKMWKGKLDRMVSKLQKEGVESTPYEDKDWQVK